nr:hypothetical protein [Tanacetum cinerariifolium]
MHSEGYDSPLSKLINTVDGELNFGLEIPDSIISEAIKQSAGYKYYKNTKDQSEEDNAKIKSEEQNMSREGRGRDEAVMLAKSVSTEEHRRKKLKGIAIKDPTVHSLLDLQKGSKESRLESMRQEMQVGKREWSSTVKDREFEYFSDIDIDAIASSSWSSDGDDTDNVKDDANNSNMDIFMMMILVIEMMMMQQDLRNLEELFEYVVDHQVSSPPATITHNIVTNPQQSLIQAKEKKLVTKARHAKLNLKKAV